MKYSKAKTLKKVCRHFYEKANNLTTMFLGSLVRVFQPESLIIKAAGEPLSLITALRER